MAHSGLSGIWLLKLGLYRILALYMLQCRIVDRIVNLYLAEYSHILTYWLVPVSMTIKKGGIRWLGRAKCVDDDADWVKYCTTVETDRTRQVSEKDLVEQWRIWASNTCNTFITSWYGESYKKSEYNAVDSLDQRLPRQDFYWCTGPILAGCPSCHHQWLM